MGKASPNWHEIAPSKFPWEQDALNFVRERFPAHEPYRAWTNFEFVAQDGSVNEVDLLVITPMGFFLVEIKSRPGIIRGDQQHWTWEGSEGDIRVADNPLLLANRKAKKLASLLKAQKAFAKSKSACPFVEALVFCSAPDQALGLQGPAASRVCLRDRPASGNQPARPGIMAALINRNCPGMKLDVPKIDNPSARAVSRALEQIGYSLAPRRHLVGDYELESMVYESPSGAFQDWLAHHVSLQDAQRRIRVYGVGTTTSKEERDLIIRAAQREAQLLESLPHENIIAADHYTNSEYGPALVYRFDPGLVRLDHYLLGSHRTMGIDERLSILRQLAEALKFAHAKRVVHRALSPQSIFVLGKGTDCRLRIMNWQAGRLFASTTASSRLTCSLHPDQLVEDTSLLYMAPEVLEGESDQCGAYMDVFSLGAITYHLFSGQPPASSLVELKTRLVEQKGLDLVATSDGACSELRDLIQYSTHPNVADRCPTVDEFLAYLEIVEDELTAPEEDAIANPLDARAGDIMQGGFQVKKRLGKGGSAIAFLVNYQGQECVLKLANRPENNERIEGEYQVLRKLKHQYIVEADKLVQINGLVGFTMQSAGKETLAQRLRDQGPLQLEFLERFGEDVLAALRFLEEKGVFHRDIKPDNLGVGSATSKGPLHVLLFDFSLSQTPVENIHAGTPGYREPFLSRRKPEPRWDLYAERYAAAVTLYQMATGALPEWGDGQTSPELLDCEASIRSEAFDPSVREGMTRFFTTALRRNPKQRFDNAELMLRAWQRIFDDTRTTTTTHETVDRDTLVKEATVDTPVAGLGVSALARQALDRVNAVTVGDLLAVPFRVLQRLKGTGTETRAEIRSLVKAIRKARPDLVQAVEATPTQPTQPPQPPPEECAEDVAPGKASIDFVARAVGNVGGKDKEGEQPFLLAYLGLEAAEGQPDWPSLSALSHLLGITKNTAWNYLEAARQRWSRMPSVTHLADDVASLLDRLGGVLSLADLGAVVLAARGSVENGGKRRQVTNAALRAVVELERAREQPRFAEYRQGEVVLVCQSPELGDYAMRLGAKADELAVMDPLPPPARVVEVLREEPLPENAGAIPSNYDLLRLAVATATNAVVSGRQELYPRGMAAIRALRLAQGALCGVRELTIDAIRERVRIRYPDAEPIPGRPQLDEALAAIGLDVVWNPAAAEGHGAFEFRRSETSTLTWSGSSGTVAGADLGMGPTQAEIDVRLFERKLAQAHSQGSFLVLSAPIKRFVEAQQRLCNAFDLERIDLDAAFLDAMQRVAKEKKVEWGLVLQTDATTPDTRDWRNLQRLVALAVSDMERRFAVPDGRTLLLHNLGLLARYDQMEVIQRLMDRVGSRADNALHGAWLLIPEDEQHARPVVDGKPVPVLGSGQYTRVPREWGRGEGERTQRREGAEERKG